MYATSNEPVNSRTPERSGDVAVDAGAASPRAPDARALAHELRCAMDRIESLEQQNAALLQQNIALLQGRLGGFGTIGSVVPGLEMAVTDGTVVA